MIFSCLLAVLFAVSPAWAEKWEVDPAHSTLGFSIVHMGLTEIDGTFNSFNGTIVWDPKAPSNMSVFFEAQAKSIDTEVARRDEHLRSADFFEVEKYPTLSFKSTRVAPLGEDRYTVEGNLTIHGVTKPVSTTAYIVGPKDVSGAQKIGFRAPFTINRLDYKVGEGKFASDAMLSHEVHIEVKGEAAVAK